MATLDTKWDALWKAFEATRKSEWLKAKETGKFNDMLKETKPFKDICLALEKGEIDMSDAIGQRKGKTHADVPFLLKSYVSKMDILRKEELKKLAKASLAEMDKVGKPNTYRALKVLITGIDEIVSLAEYKEKTLQKNAVELGKVLTQQEMIDKVASLAVQQVKKAVMKALAELQKVKATPTVATWDQLVKNGGTRDLCMALVSLETAQTKGGFSDLPNAKALKDQAQPFNTQQPKAALNPADGEKEVKERAKEWSTLVKKVADSYQKHW